MKRNQLKLLMTVALISVVLISCVKALYGQEPESNVRILTQTGLIIVLPAAPTTIEQDAAALLARTLEKTLGAKAAVVSEKEYMAENRTVIAVGRTGMAEKNGLLALLGSAKNESIGIGVWPEKSLICLTGNEELSVYFAVARFLERYAEVRWFFPDELGLCIPKKTVLEIPAGVEIQTPAFPVRWVGKEFAKDWALFNGTNTNIDKRGGFHVFESAHTFHDFVPPEKYFKTHPEYFSEVNGERVPKQLCTSNPAVIDLVISAMLRLFEQRPELDMITLFPEDGRSFCECPKCRAQDSRGDVSVYDINVKKVKKKAGPESRRVLSKRMTIFYLSVARKVLEVKPGKKIQVGAYSAYFLPPSDFKEKAPENVFILMCHGACHNHPIASDTCEINLKFRKAMEGWKEIYEGITIYEYYRKAAMFDLPFPIIHSIEKDIPFYKNYGVKALFTQFSKDYYTIGLNYYVTARLLWDSTLNVKEILDDFYQKFYQEALEPMREYHMNYEDAAIKSGLTLAPHVSDFDLLFTDDLIERQDKLIKKALSLAKDDRVRERIRRAGISLDYVRMCMNYLKQAKNNTRNQLVTDSVSLKNMANTIREYRGRHKGYYPFGPENNYIKRFLNSKWILKEISKKRDNTFEEESSFSTPSVKE